MEQKLLQVAERAARAAGEVLRPVFGSAVLDVEMKEKHDFVTSADRQAEQVILDTLMGEFPDHRVVAEESGRSGGAGEFEWLIDPLDGTTNFLEGLPLYGVSIACRQRRETVVAVVYDPERDDLFCAVRGAGAWRNGARMSVSGLQSLDGAFLATGYPFKARAALDVYLDVFRSVFLQARAIRRCGAATLDLAYTAAGTFDGFFEFRLASWDIAAGALLIEEAGGGVCDLDGGSQFLRTGNILAGPKGVLETLRAVVSNHVDEALLDRLVPRSTVGVGHSC